MIDNNYVLVPIEMCVFVAKENLENPFRLYLLLKLIYPSGKFKLSKNEVELLANKLGVTNRTIKNLIKRLDGFNWIRLNSKTKYYLIYSFDRIRRNNNWLSRASIEFYFEYIHRTRAILGAAIYGYLHKDYWRKQRERIVTIKGVTYQSLSSSFNYKNHSSPISVYGVNKIFNISIPKASRLKKFAANEGLIKVEKQYKKLDIPKFGVDGFKEYYPEVTNNLIYKDGNYYLQIIDLILPLFDIRRRKKLEP